MVQICSSWCWPKFWYFLIIGLRQNIPAFTYCSVVVVPLLLYVKKRSSTTMYKGSRPRTISNANNGKEDVILVVVKSVTNECKVCYDPDLLRLPTPRCCSICNNWRYYRHIKATGISLGKFATTVFMSRMSSRNVENPATYQESRKIVKRQHS